MVWICALCVCGLCTVVGLSEYLWVWFGFVSFVNSVGMRGFCGCYVFWYLFAGIVVLFDSRSSVG